MSTTDFAYIVVHLFDARILHGDFDVGSWRSHLLMPRMRPMRMSLPGVCASWPGDDQCRSRHLELINELHPYR